MFKKSVITLGTIIVISSFTYCIASWYTGKQIEKNINQQLTLLTNKISQFYPELTFQVTLANYNRHIFSSQFDYQLTSRKKSDTPEAQALFTQILHEGTITIAHGPFPLLLLKAGQFAPKQFFIDYDFAATTSYDFWRKASGERLPINVQVITDYNNKSTINTHFIPLKYDDGLQSIDFSGATIHLTTSDQFDTTNIDSKLDQLILSIADAKLTVENFSLDIAKRQKNTDYRLKNGLVEIALNNNKTVLSLNGLAANQTIKPTNHNEQYDFLLNYRLNNLQLNHYSLGSGDLTMNVDNFPGSMLHLGYNPLITIMVFDHYIYPLLFDELINAETAIHIKQFNWQNSLGKARLSLDAALTKESNVPISNLKQYESTFSASIPMLVEILSRLSYMNTSDINDNMREKIKHELLTLPELKFIEINNDQLESFIKYLPETDQMMINDKQFSIEEFNQLTK